ncbi:hypothetical protein Trydic_g14511 [Trypoxylus dichotomus]
MWKVATLQSSITETYDQIYRSYHDCKYVGIYVMNRPAILLRDPEVIEDALVKNFSNFHDNDIEIKIEHDSVFGNNPFVLRGDDWKTKRTQHLLSLTPAKVKLMLPELESCADRMVTYLRRQIEKNSGTFCMESLELAARYTTETVTAVGVNINANSFTDGVPELRIAGKVIFEPALTRGIKLYFLFLIPKITNIIPLRMMPKSLIETYKNLIVQTLKYRAENNIQKDDFFDHLQEFRGDRQSLDEMTAQLGGMYIDGFGTNSGALNFIIYNLAAYQDVQEKLREEIREYFERSDGKLTADDILEMPYLDAVLCESLRKYPPFPIFTRRCTESYTLPKARDDASELTVEVGTPVIIPAYSLHNDEKHFPNPQQFDPERFFGTNKNGIEKYAYIPFGQGPRICLGMRFAILQTKVAMIKLVQNFKLSVNYTRTKLPIRLHPHGIILAAKDSLWINFKEVN